MAPLPNIEWHATASLKSTLIADGGMDQVQSPGQDPSALSNLNLEAELVGAPLRTRGSGTSAGTRSRTTDAGMEVIH